MEQTVKKVTLENLQPVNSRILIRILDEVEEYEGTIELVQTQREKSDIGLVEKCPIGYTDFVEGEKIIFNRNSGTPINFDKFNREAPEYRLIKPEDILCRILNT